LPIDPGCLFCGDEACPAHADKVRKTKARKAAPVAKAQESTTEDWPTEKKESAFKKRASESNVVLSQDDLLFREALRNLWPIISEQDKFRFKDIVEPPVGADVMKERVEVRRQINGNL